LLDLKLRTTTNLTQYSTSFTDTMPKLWHKIHPSDKAFFNCVMYETTHILENLQEAYGLLSFGCCNRLLVLPDLGYSCFRSPVFAQVQLREYMGGTFKKPLFCSLNFYCFCLKITNNSRDATLPGWRLCWEHSADWLPSVRSTMYSHFHLACSFLNLPFSLLKDSPIYDYVI
jgi:hypothetical protein